MKVRVIAAVAVCVALLSACGSKKEASESNFSEVINSHFSHSCLQLDPSNMFGPHSYPASVAMIQPGMLFTKKAADDQNARVTAPFNALVSAGLLTVQDAPVPAQFGPAGSKVPGKTYTLTDAGEKALADQQNKKGTAFCAGHFKVQSIVRFTPPADAVGHTISEVVYTYKAVDVPAWAASKDVTAAFPNMAEFQSKDQQGRATLVLANDGWITSDDFSRQ
jgi:hypothetical protein